MQSSTATRSSVLYLYSKFFSIITLVLCTVPVPGTPGTVIVETDALYLISTSTSSGIHVNRI